MTAEPKITQDMVWAGLRALDEARGAYSEEETVKAVYSAMDAARPAPEKPARLTILFANETEQTVTLSGHQILVLGAPDDITDLKAR